MKKTISGIRGIVNDDIVPVDVIRFCSSFASLTGGKCVTGMDTRPSSQIFMYAAHAALMAEGVDVYNLGMVPTPVVFREARCKTAGLVVTSSHNPVEWNGLKFIVDGRGINEDELAAIVGQAGSTCAEISEISCHDSAAKGDMQTSSKTARDGQADGYVRRSTVEYTRQDSSTRPGREYECAASQYVDDAAKVIGDAERGTRVAVDIGGGAAADIVPKLLGTIGCNTTIINADLASCTRGPDPTTDRLDDLVNASLAADIGFAFDLDGDRLVIVRDGIKETPDTTLGLGVAMALEMGCNSFVISTDTSVAVEKLIADEGGSCIRSKVGEANVVGEMMRIGAQAGGEGSSGGFILGDFNYCRDGILTSGFVSCLLSNETRFKEILNYMKRYHMIRTKMQANSARHKDIMERAEAWMGSECSEIDRLDGLKGILDEDTWILIRRSNTEDVIRISAESDNKDRCKDAVKRIVEAMQTKEGA